MAVQSPYLQTSQHFENIVNSSDDAIISKTLDGIITSWNPAAEKIFGYTAQEMLGQKMLILFPHNRVDEETMILEKIARGEKVDHFKTQRRHKSGKTLEISATISPIFNREGQIIGASKIARDITEQSRAEQKILQYKSLVDSSEDGIISKSLNGIILTWNTAAQKIFGYTPEEAVGKPIHIIFPPERLQEEDKLLKTVLSGSPVRHFRTTRLHKDGRRIFVSVSLSAVYDQYGEIQGFSKIVRDLTQEIQHEQALWHDVHFDSLTGLMSRVGIKNALEDMIQISHSRERHLALVYINIRNFKAIVHQLGAEISSELLIKVAHQIKSNIRESDDAAHLHADQFAVLLQGFRGTKYIQFTIEKIKNAIESITEIANQSIAMTTTIGTALYPEDGSSFQVLSKKAEHNLQTAKISGLNFPQNFTSGTSFNKPDDFFLIQELTHAIENNQFHLVYQPIVNATNHKINKAEALIRWKHPEMGYISPAAFIPLAEKYGLIRTISRWVLQNALKDLQEFTEIYGLDFQLSINRSSYDFYDYEECVKEMRDALYEHGLCGSNLLIEVTEYSLIGNAEITQEILRAYHDLDISIALDDFGTGYSSLEYLKRYPVDIIKIDREFVNALETSNVQYHLCDGIMKIAQALNLKVVAEGVETELESQMLSDLNVDYFQGFYFSKPLEKPEFIQLLTKST